MLVGNIPSSNEKTWLLYALRVGVLTGYTARLDARVVVIDSGKGRFLHSHRRLVLVLLVDKVRLNLSLIIVGGCTSGGPVRRKPRVFAFLQDYLMLLALRYGSGGDCNLDLLLGALTPPSFLVGRCLRDILLVASLSRLLLFTVRVYYVFALRVLLMLVLT